ncbi:hypothetical protein L6164_017023 [Bauhinia variegata]|uniref:Uncharacterized protein n=1 Tax=Bauhinia variegata TaxID=167791 RepID=A0ACB9NA83_BAUVA|nr:hypothetical protein L6164_017023 [Bauhinia variegata]
MKPKMYEQSGCFDPNTIAQTVADSTLPPLLVAPNNTNSFEDNLFYHPHNPPCPEDVSALTTMEITHQNHLGLNMGNQNSINNFLDDNVDTHLVQEVIDVVPYDHDQSTWGVEELQEMGYGIIHQQDDQHPNDQQFQQIEAQNCSQSYNSNNSSTILDHSYPSPDLLNLLHLPRCSNFQNSMGFFGDFQIGTETTTASSVLYDPLLHLNLPPQPPALRELFQSLPRGYSLPTSRNGSSLFGGGDDIDANGVVYQDGDNEMLEFNREIGCVGKGRAAKGSKHFATEKQRREQLNGKYKILRSLIPKPTKIDRASVVGDAIDYIRELLRTVSELKLLVEKKRYGKEMSKRRKTEDDAAESCNMKPFGDLDGCIRTSWLQRKSKDTEVDVRIIDDEVTIKLVHRKNINSLLSVSKVLEELQLDLHHVAGGHVGEYGSFLFNSKIYEGSSLYASAIANKVIEVMDRQYAAAVPTTSSY